ncbi:MAG: hypothetical protein QNK18_16800 [Gammaproteobacteria bacterium]|nr:hypothetical protein [Gammaproteobacteria bacterium]
MNIPRDLAPQLETPDGEDIELWSEEDGDRRSKVRIPTGSKVIAEPMRGPPRWCLIRNVGEGGICLDWPAAGVSVNEAVNLVFIRPDQDTGAKIERVGVVKWYSATRVGIVFRESLLKGQQR